MSDTSGELSYLLHWLLEKGTLVPDGRELGLPVPGMADWVGDRDRA